MRQLAAYPRLRLRQCLHQQLLLVASPSSLLVRRWELRALLEAAAVVVGRGRVDGVVAGAPVEGVATMVVAVAGGDSRSIEAPC